MSNIFLIDYPRYYIGLKLQHWTSGKYSCCYIIYSMLLIDSLRSRVPENIFYLISKYLYSFFREKIQLYLKFIEVFFRNAIDIFYLIICSCFTTEILEGFNVQRASSLRDTLDKYGYLTRSIAQYYSSLLPEDQSKCADICPPFNEFIKRCEDLEKMTVSDVFAIQLMQVNFPVELINYQQYWKYAIGLCVAQQKARGLNVLIK